MRITVLPKVVISRKYPILRKKLEKSTTDLGVLQPAFKHSTK